MRLRRRGWALVAGAVLLSSVACSTGENDLDATQDLCILDRLDSREIDGEEMTGFSLRISLDELFGFMHLDPDQVPLAGTLVSGPYGVWGFPMEL